MRVRFGDCVFDSDARRATLRGVALALSPRAFQLLSVLIESRPRALAKEDLRDRLWPGTFVSHTSLARLVSEVRRALGGNSRAPGFVRTVQRFGYAFDGEAEELGELVTPPTGPGYAHALRWGAREIALFEGENVVGRDAGSRLRIVSPSVSRRHARILVEGARATLEDLGSKNGTFLAGKPVAGATVLEDGDEIVVGREVLVYWAAGAAGTTRTGRLR